MSRPSDIPESVWAAAREAADAVLVASGSGLRHYSFQSTIDAIITASARAIMAAEARERERCALSLEGLRADQIRLHMGEVSAQGMRDITAFANWRATAIRQGSQPSNVIPHRGDVS